MQPTRAATLRRGPREATGRRTVSSEASWPHAVNFYTGETQDQWGRVRGVTLMHAADVYSVLARPVDRNANATGGEVRLAETVGGQGLVLFMVQRPRRWCGALAESPGEAQGQHAPPSRRAWSCRTPGSSASRRGERVAERFRVRRRRLAPPAERAGETARKAGRVVRRARHRCAAMRPFVRSSVETFKLAKK